MSRLDSLAGEDLDLRLAAHRNGWPADRERLAELTGTALRELLAGRPWTAEAIDEQRAQLVVPWLTEDDDRALQALLPDVGERTWLASAIRIVPRFVDLELDVLDVDGGPELGRLGPSGATRLGRLVVGPVLTRLLGHWRLRTGDGPASSKGRLAAAAAAVEAHLLLGLDPGPSERLLDPEADRAQLAALRADVGRAWSSPPADLGHRALALLLGDLAARARKKRRRDGAVREADVLTSTTQVLCDALLGGWEGFVAYAGLEGHAPVRPVAAAISLPSEPPAEVVDRLAVLRAWWEHADAAWATQEAGGETLWGMTPERSHRFGPAEPGDGPRSADGFAGAAKAEALWSARTERADPTALVPELEPLAAMAELLGPAYAFWEGVALTVYYLTHGPYSRTSLEDAPAYHQHLHSELQALGAPVDPVLWDELQEAAGPDPRALPGDPSRGLVLEFRIDVGDQQFEDDEDEDPTHRAFEAMRDVATRHRRTWMREHLDRALDRPWREDLQTAAADIAQRIAERHGRPPTLKQAWPVLAPPANRWFDGDYARLGEVLGLEGPWSSAPRPTGRAFPEDVPSLVRDVAHALDGDVRSRDWPRRRRGEVAARSEAVLRHWVATGAAPSASAAGVARLLDEAWPRDARAGYGRFLAAIAAALRDRGHPAAADFAPAAD